MRNGAGLDSKGYAEDFPVIREQVLKLLHQIPFQPFSADVAADVAYAIPTPDHVLAAKKVLVIEDDGGFVDVIPYSHIRRISFSASPTPQS